MGFNITAVGTIFIKEAGNCTPFLKFGSAAKNPKLTFALTMVRENNIDRAERRIYSGKSSGTHILDKKNEIVFLTNHFI